MRAIELGYEDVRDEVEDLTITLCNSEKLIVGSFLVFLLAIVVIAAWSGVLLYLGHEEGGGPIGSFIRLFNVQRLISNNDFTAHM